MPTSVPASKSAATQARPRPGFTITELLVVIALIIVLLSLLAPALAGVWSTGKMTVSMSRMRQIALWMTEYSSDNRERVLPAAFDYRDVKYPGKARSSPNPQMGEAHYGAWADILATVFQVPGNPDAAVEFDNDYRFDSVDQPLYDLVGRDSIGSPFRSAAPNTYNAREYVGPPGMS